MNYIRSNEPPFKQDVEIEQLIDVLLRNGFVRCDIPACNCGSWHHRYGLPERWQEIKHALVEADVLDNSTGNKPLLAVEKLIAQRNLAFDELERLRDEISQLLKSAERNNA